MESRKLQTSLGTILLFCVANVSVGGETEEHRDGRRMVETILKEYPTSIHAVVVSNGWQNSEVLLNGLCDYWSITNDNERQKAFLVEMSIHPKALGPGRYPRSATTVTNAGVIHTLIKAVDGDYAPDVREYAAFILCSVNTNELRKWTPTLIEVAAKKVSDMGPQGLLLLGLTGSDAIRQILSEAKTFEKTKCPEWLVALGKLGDTNREQEVIQNYLREEDNDNRGRWARYLGRMGTPNAVKTLASDLRTTRRYRGGKIDFRLAVIGGLRIAFPEERIFVTAPDAALTEKYFERVEEWAELRLGTTWQTPRPPVHSGQTQ